MKSFSLPVLLMALAMSNFAHAEIYKRVDKDGRVTYSSSPAKGAEKLQLEPLPTMKAQSVPPRQRTRTTSEDFPRVDSETQSRRDDTRRKILEDELATEERALLEARTKLKDAQDSPEVFKGANGQTYRNMAKYEEKVNAAEDDLKSHEKNIQSLKNEISRLK